MASVCGQRLEPIIYAEVTLHKLSGVCPMVLLIFLCNSPEPVFADGRRWAVAKDVDLYPVLDYVFCENVDSVPEESWLVSVIFSHNETMKCLLLLLQVIS